VHRVARTADTATSALAILQLVKDDLVHGSSRRVRPTNATAGGSPPPPPPLRGVGSQGTAPTSEKQGPSRTGRAHGRPPGAKEAPTDAPTHVHRTMSYGRTPSSGQRRDSIGTNLSTVGPASGRASAEKLGPDGLRLASCASAAGRPRVAISSAGPIQGDDQSRNQRDKAERSPETKARERTHQQSRRQCVLAVAPARSTRRKRPAGLVAQASPSGREMRSL